MLGKFAASQPEKCPLVFSLFPIRGKSGLVQIRINLLPPDRSSIRSSRDKATKKMGRKEKSVGFCQVYFSPLQLVGKFPVVVMKFSFL